MKAQPFATVLATLVVLRLFFDIIPTCEAAGDVSTIIYGAENKDQQGRLDNKQVHSPSAANNERIYSMIRNLDSSCTDSPLKVLTAKKKKKSARTCKFIAKKSERYCVKDSIKTHCPSACKVCDTLGTVDSEGTFVFKGQKKDCTWLHGLVTLTSLDKLSEWCDVDELRETCRYTCGFFCASEIASANPSAIPSQAPSEDLPCSEKIVAIIESEFGEVIDGSPQKQALDWLIEDISDDDCSNQLLIFQRYALATLYHSTGGDGWYWKDGWLGSEDECGWSGLSCNDDKALTGISLDYVGLNGTLPSEVNALDSLETLHLSMNYDLTGTIPDLSGLFNLQDFTAYYNYFTGSIAGVFDALAKLKTLYLAGNSFTGTFPDLSRTSLEELYASYNNFTGPIGGQFDGLTNLTLVDFGSNKLDGEIDPDIFKLPNLRSLYLEGNELVGSIPYNFGGSTSLESLFLYDNFLTGSIPGVTGNTLQNIRYLELYSNKMSGPVPESLCDLKSESNQFSLLTADCAPPNNAQNPCLSECCTSCYVGKGLD